MTNKKPGRKPDEDILGVIHCREEFIRGMVALCKNGIFGKLFVTSQIALARYIWKHEIILCKKKGGLHPMKLSSIITMVNEAWNKDIPRGGKHHKIYGHELS